MAMYSLEYKFCKIEILCKRSVILEFDGASSGNPGKSGVGAVLRDGNKVQCFSQGLGTQTNRCRTQTHQETN
ncbi:RNase H family protein, partial [Trifolium pratense]